MAKNTRTDYNRQELIDLLERSSIPEDRWSNRDSAEAQMQAGECLALLKAGCDFELSKSLETDDKTIWVRIWFKGFNWFEGHDEQDPPRDQKQSETFYVPTDKRLKEVDGGDWYC